MTPADLRAARLRLGMNQKQFAEALRLRGDNPDATVRSWEKGRRPITGPVQVVVEMMLERLDRREEP